MPDSSPRRSHQLTVKANGPRIRELREAAGWSQEDLAEQSGLGVRTIQGLESSRLESSRKVLPRATIQPVADALGVHRLELIMGLEPRPGTTELPKGNLGAMIPGSRAGIDETVDVIRVADAFAPYFHSTTYVMVCGIREGSVIIDFEMDMETLAAITQHFISGDLSDAGLMGLLIPKDTPVPFSLAAELLALKRHPFSIRPYSDAELQVILALP